MDPKHSCITHVLMYYLLCYFGSSLADKRISKDTCDINIFARSKFTCFSFLLRDFTIIGVSKGRRLKAMWPFTQCTHRLLFLVPSNVR